MFFKNKSTGVVHEVNHEDTIKRCQKDDNYEEVKKPTKPKSNKPQTAKKDN